MSFIQKQIVVLLFVFLFSTLNGFLVYAVDTCGLTISSGSISVQWSQGFVSQIFQFNISKEKNQECDYIVTFSSGGASDYNRRAQSGSESLYYQLYKDSNFTQILKELPDITNDTEMVKGSFPKGKDLTQTQSIYFHIPQGSVVSPVYKPSGVYVNSFVMKVYQGSSHIGLSNPEHTVTVQVQIAMPKLLEISLVNSGSVFDPNQTAYIMSLGSLSQGVSQGLDLLVRTNAGYSVSFSSQNNGVMKHVQPNIQTVVPYSLSVNGSVKSLTQSQISPVAVAQGSGQTSQQGSRNAVQVTIGNTEQSLAGAYSDLITVTAITTE